MMEEDLAFLLLKLKPFAETAESRGSGKSKFLYVTGNGRSVEVSCDEKGYWVEYWDDLSEEAKPVREQSFVEINLVEESVRNWFQK